MIEVSNKGKKSGQTEFLMIPRSFTFLSILISGVSCIKRPLPNLSPDTPHVLRWATTALPEVKDWTECTTSACRRHGSLVMEGLVRPDRKNEELQVAPALAASWKATNSKEWTFELRQNVRWTDGKALEPSHFTQSWKKLLTHCKHRPAARLLFIIQNAEDYCKKLVPFSKVGIDVSENKITLRLNRPSAFFPRLVAHPAFWPRRLDTERETVTLGAFKSDGRPGRYHRNPAYYRGTSDIDAIEFVVVPSAQERVALFRERAVDVVEDLSKQVQTRLVSDDPNRITAATSERLYLLVHSAVRPFQSSAARRALFQATDVQEVIRNTGASLLPTSQLTGDTPSLSNPPDPEAARAFFAAMKEEVPRLKLEWDGSAALEPVVRNLQAQWSKNVGLEVELVVRSKAATHQPAALSLLSWRESWVEPALPPFIASNAPGFATSAAALRYWERAQSQWMGTESLVLPLFEHGRSLLRRPGLSPLELSPFEDWQFSDMRWG